MPKFVPCQRESSKQVDIQNLPKCCVDSLVGPQAQVGGAPPLVAPTLGRPVSYIFSSRHLRNLSLIYLLALATTEQPPSCRRRVIQTPPSSDIKIARLAFSFNFCTVEFAALPAPSAPTTWAELKAAMRCRFVPSYYARNVECDVQERRSK
jgi:hypothetical protein